MYDIYTKKVYKKCFWTAKFPKGLNNKNNTLFFVLIYSVDLNKIDLYEMNFYQCINKH